MERGAPSDPFALDLNRVFIEYPDNVETLQFPSIAFVPGRGQYIPRSALGGASVAEDTYNQNGPGSALLIAVDYKEAFTIEIWASKIAERRAMVAAIETMFFSYDGTTDLRIILEDYYGLVATFTLMSERISKIWRPLEAAEGLICM